MTEACKSSASVHPLGSSKVACVNAKLIASAATEEFVAASHSNGPKLVAIDIVGGRLSSIVTENEVVPSLPHRSAKVTVIVSELSQSGSVPLQSSPVTVTSDKLHASVTAPEEIKLSASVSI